MSENIFTHNLTPGLVDTLRQFGLAVRNKGRYKIHIRNDMTLGITENNNFQKLKHWGLVAKYKENGVHIAGYWVLTRRGAAFLRNEIDMPKKVTTQSNHKIGESEERIMIADTFSNYGEDYWQTNFGKLNPEQTTLIL